MVLLANEGQTNRQIAERLHTRTARVSQWRQRFGIQRLAGLLDAPRSGKPARYDKSTEKRVLTLLDQPPPQRLFTMERESSGRGLAGCQPTPNMAHSPPARHLFAAPSELVHRYRSRVRPQGRRCGWALSEPTGKRAGASGRREAVHSGFGTGPRLFAATRWPSRQWYSHGYKRHGTTTLFAALEITTGLVKTGHYRRRRRREFLDFMNEIVTANPDREIHGVLDNLNTHKPKDDRWLKRHSQVHFHFIPTYSSWLHQVECWFSILSRQALQGASFTSPQQLRQAIAAFVEVYNEKAAPFEWKKAVVFPSGPKSKYSDYATRY